MPAERNAHPHMSGEQVAIVHNGIIENHAELRTDLQAQGFEFSSDTDTEVRASAGRAAGAGAGYLRSDAQRDRSPGRRLCAWP